jgi:hypothetical protein
VTNEREIKKGLDSTGSGRCRFVMHDCDGKEETKRNGGRGNHWLKYYQFANWLY